MARAASRALAWPGVVALGALAGPLGVYAASNAHVAAATRPYRFSRADALPALDWAIVPGARVFPGGRPSNPLRERLAAAAELLAVGRVARILVSGDAAAPEGDEPGAMAAFLEALGVPAAAITRDPSGARTLLTMRAARRLLGPCCSATSVVVCTQAFHLPRAVYLARASGLQALGLEVDRRLDPFALRNAARESVARVRAVWDVRCPRGSGAGPR